MAVLSRSSPVATPPEASTPQADAELVQFPGYQIEREIGRGGMARVYLAVQTKFDRLVALKVVSSEYARHDDFRRRFLSESRINAQLNHPNIVQVHDVAEHDDKLYLVMEYLSGGDLNQRLDRGMHIQGVIKVVKDIGRALDYAHGKGIVHRDIKPENILFREDGSAVLTDFGIARAQRYDASHTRAGTVVGTPQYMSPEQAAGRELDGRSDLYGLGVVFYRMLTGDVPYKADTAVAVGVKHLQEAIPRLPTYLSAFQEVIDRALAKKPEARYQSGAELAAALDGIRSNVKLPNATIKSQAVTTQEIRAVAASMLTTMPDPHRAERTRKQERRRRTLRGSLVTVALASLLLVGGYWLVNQPGQLQQVLSMLGLEGTPGLEQAWVEARSLRQDPNQGLAAVVAGYQRVLTLSPEDAEAQQAVAELAVTWKTDIAKAIQAGEHEIADGKLAEAQIAFPDDEDFSALEAQLMNVRQANDLFAETRATLESWRTDEDVANAGDSVVGTIQTLQEVLRLQPDNVVARDELDRVAAALARLAQASITAGEVEPAIGLLDRASSANPQLPEIAAVRSQIQQTNTTRVTIAQILEEARVFRTSGALVTPPGQNAAELYHKVLSIDPDNSVAQHGLDELWVQLHRDVENDLATGAFAEATLLVDRATTLGLDAGKTSELRDRLNAERNRQQTVSQLLADARNQFADGFLTEPPSANAASSLRELQRLDPENVEARELLRQVAERLVGVANEAYAVGFTDEAKKYLDLALTLEPEVVAWQRLRDAWEVEVAPG